MVGLGRDNFSDQLQSDQMQPPLSQLPLVESESFVPIIDDSEDDNFSDNSLLDLLFNKSSLEVYTNILDDAFNDMLSLSDMMELEQSSLLHCAPVESESESESSSSFVNHPVDDNISKQSRADWMGLAQSPLLRPPVELESYSSFVNHPVDENISNQSLSDRMELAQSPLLRPLFESESETESESESSFSVVNHPVNGMMIDSAILLRIDTNPYKPILPKHIELNICHICDAGPIIYRWKYGAVHCAEGNNFFMRECRYSQNLRDEN